MRYVDQKTVKSCQYCRRLLDKDYDVCPYCGGELKSSVENQFNDNYEDSHMDDDEFVFGESGEPNPKGKKVGMICGICGGVIAVVLIVCFVITSSNINKTKNFEAKNAVMTSQTTTTQVSAAPPSTTSAKPVVVSMTKPSKVKITKVNALKKGFKITWKKIPGATKYRVKVSANKKGNNNVSYETVSSDKNSVTVKGLKKKSNYYVRVKAITINYGVKVEGDYSKYVSKKTK